MINPKKQKSQLAVGDGEVKYLSILSSISFSIAQYHFLNRSHLQTSLFHETLISPAGLHPQLERGGGKPLQLKLHLLTHPFLLRHASPQMTQAQTNESKHGQNLRQQDSKHPE